MTNEEACPIPDDLLKVQDPILHYINSNFISITPSDRTAYTQHLNSVLSELTAGMKKADELFNFVYQKFVFAGSYPDNLKVGKPEEFDMNLVIKLPSINHSDMKLEESDEASFVKVNMKKVILQMEQNPKWEKYIHKVKTWIDDEGYLLQNKFRGWMESVLAKTFNNFSGRKIQTSHGTCQVGDRKAGPALTLTIVTPEGLKFDVDLVPAFVFEHPTWPPKTRKLAKGAEKKTWYIIPKPKGNENKEKDRPRKWRVSFQEQETELLKGSGTVKNIIRLLKKLRDRSNIKSKDLSSYAIKTVVMWEMEKQQKDTKFWEKRLSYLFISMLNRVIQLIKESNIPFYWDQRNNLLDMSRDKKSMLGHLERIYKDFLNKMAGDPYIIAKKLLTDDEFIKFEGSYQPPNVQSPVTVQAQVCSVVSPVTDPVKVSATKSSVQHQNNSDLLTRIASLESKVKSLEKRLADANDRHTKEITEMKAEFLEHKDEVVKAVRFLMSSEKCSICKV